MADNILNEIENGMMWPDNLLICAVSLSKSHTIYGLRTGAGIHAPEKEVTDRLDTVMSVNGRQT